MSISEQVGFLDDAIKGHVKVQLMEQDKVVQEVEGDNFIGAGVYNWLLALLASTFVDFFSNYTQVQGNQTGILPFACPLEQFVLTDNSIPVNSNSPVIPGNVISGGTVSRQPYAGSDRGTVNNLESNYDYSSSKLKLVMDFSTSAANGTFQTVGFRKTSRFNKGLSIYERSRTNSYSTCCSYGDKLYVRVSSSAVDEFDLISRTTRRISFSSTAFNRISVHDGVLYLHQLDSVASNRKVFSVDLSTPFPDVVELGALSTAPSNYNTNASNFWADANYFYVTGRHQSNAIYITAYNKTTLSVVKNSYISLDSSAHSLEQTHAKYYSGGKTYIESYTGAIICLTDYVQSTTVPSFTSPSFLELGAYQSYEVAIKGDGTKIGSVPVTTPHFLSSTSASTGTGTFSGAYPLADLASFHAADLGTCVVLPTPVTKTSEQTMKITYELTFNFK